LSVTDRVFLKRFQTGEKLPQFLRNVSKCDESFFRRKMFCRKFGRFLLFKKEFVTKYIPFKNFDVEFSLKFTTREIPIVPLLQAKK
jgi:hypothetical protein